MQSQQQESFLQAAKKGDVNQLTKLISVNDNLLLCRSEQGQRTSSGRKMVRQCGSRDVLLEITQAAS